MQKQSQAITTRTSRFDNILPQILADARLSDFDATIEVRNALFKFLSDPNNTPMQKSALLSKIPFEATLELRDLKDNVAKSEDKSRAYVRLIDYIQSNILQTAKLFVKPFLGDAKFVAESIYENYGGLNFLDLARFFESCQKLEFADGRQSVTTFGLSAEYLLNWIGKFAEERFERTDAIIHGQKKEFDKVEFGVNGEVVEKLSVQITENKRLLHIAEGIQRQRDESLKERKTIKIQIDDTTIKDIEVYEYKQTAYAYLMRETIDLFFTFGDKPETEAIIQRFKARATKEHGTTDSDLSLTDFLHYRAKVAYMQIKEAINKANAIDVASIIIERAFKQRENQTQTFIQFINEAFGANASGEISLNRFSAQYVSALTNHYNDYLRRTIQDDRCPLVLHEWRLQVVLYALKRFSNPFAEIFLKDFC